MKMKAFVLIMIVFFASWAELIVQPVERNDLTSKGVRIYASMPLLIVTCLSADVVFIPDYTRA